MANRATRMAGGDATWLHLDRPRNRMIVNTVLWTAAPVDWDRVIDRLERHVIPDVERLRTRALDPPFTFGFWGGARWEPVPVAVEAHLVRTTLPGPGDDAALWAYVAEQAARPLPAQRPLWRVHAIDGYGPGSALLLRTHHAMADGTAIMRLVELLTGESGSAGAVPDGTEAGRPRVFDPVTWTDADVLTKLVAAIPGSAAPVTPLSGTKAAGWTAAVALDDLRRAGAGHGATVNDVGLAAVAGGLRRHLGAGEAGRELQAVVPVNLRGPGEAVTTALGNRFGLVFVPLPVDVRGAGARIRRVKAEMDRIKASREAQMVYDAFVVLGQSPRASARSWVDAFSRRARLVVTNIRGPAAPVRLGGAPVAGMALFVPSTGPVGIGVSICTYAGSVRFGLICDDAVVADADGLRQALGDALVEVVDPGSGEGGPGVAGEGPQDINDTVA
jgi:diacylglycerol O-acyltransferase